MTLTIIKEFKEEINDIFRKVNIRSNDCVLLHADTSQIFLKYKRKDINFNYNIILQTILDYLKDGTLILPTFNFQFCTNNIYDYINTPSKMGRLSETLRIFNKMARTKHPVYSFSVYGKFCKDFLSCNNFEAFSNDSPFAKLLKNRGKIVIWNLDGQRSMTFYHFIERENKVDYRFDKIFEGIYKDRENNSYKKKFSLFVRDVKNKVITNVHGMENILWKKKIYIGDKFNEGNRIRVANTDDVFQEVSAIIQKGDAYGNLYERQ